jgi:hypothetical protein
MLEEELFYAHVIVTLSRMLPNFNIATCTPIARQRVGKQVPAKTDS